MEIFFSFFLFPIFHSPSAREILRKQKELEKYFSYCTLHRVITSIYFVNGSSLVKLCQPLKHFLLMYNKLVYEGK